MKTALLYDNSAYVETLSIDRGNRGSEAPVALVGRQVAGREFLNAYLDFGDYEQLTGIVWNQTNADAFAATCRNHPRASKHPLEVRLVDRFLDRGGLPAAGQLYTPCPPDSSFAWMRYERGPATFSLSGVTHTLCTSGAARMLCELVTAPFEEHDALICTSNAVIKMVHAVTGAYADYLSDRFGCAPVLRPRLEMIPLGVDPERYRPPTPAERSSRRAQLNIRPEAVAVLFVGRFTPHAKAHPFPMLQGLARTARETGTPVHLILSGWAAGDEQLRLYLDAVKAFAPGIPVSVVNGLDRSLRFGVWQAADIFTSLVDSIQETFGLVIVEAMASGLPVVATDWDGYRDLVVDGETGFLASTYLVEGTTTETTLRLLLGATDYDGFLAECNQATVVDPDSAAAAYTRLIRDAALRKRMGEAGRQRVLERFTWERVVKAYEQLWREQEQVRLGQATTRKKRPTGPPCYPAPETAFAGYPTAWLGQDAAVIAAADALERLGVVLSLPLCTYAGQRIHVGNQLRELLNVSKSPRRIGELTAMLVQQGAAPAPASATVAWLLKYGLLKRV
jgi:glycosyltransferase involved in cell wall biosynthesis